MEALGKKRVQLEAQLADAAVAGGSKVMHISAELGKVVDELESKEVRWLELAEIAGDI